MLSVQSLREKLDEYAEGGLSVEALEEWLASSSWDMRRWVSTGLQRVVEHIQASLIEYSDGSIGQDDLRNELLRRRDQLLRAQQATAEIKKQRAEIDSELKNVSCESTISEALVRLEHAVQG
jgi:hypothetical protein